MLKVNKGAVVINGEPMEIMSEFTCLIGALRKVLTDECKDERTTDEIIAVCGRVAFENISEEEMNVIGGKIDG